MAPVSQGQILSHFSIEMEPTFICHILVDDREEAKKSFDWGPFPFSFVILQIKPGASCVLDRMLYHLAISCPQVHFLRRD